jgi:hypothetical protein
VAARLAPAAGGLCRLASAICAGYAAAPSRVNPAWGAGRTGA